MDSVEINGGSTQCLGIMLLSVSTKAINNMFCIMSCEIIPRTPQQSGAEQDKTVVSVWIHATCKVSPVYEDVCLY